MDGAGLKVDGNSETPSKENEELSVLQAIIDNGSCDVGTQTNILSSNSRVTQFTPPTRKHSQGINLSNGPSNRSRRSSFRLFIVPDDRQAPNSNAFDDSGLRLSFDKKRHESNDQSLYFSVTSNSRNEESKTTESFSKNIKIDKKNKMSKNTFKQNERTRKDTASFTSLEKGNTDEPMRSIDHQLVHSTNPSVLAWLKLKNFEEREKRRVKKHEKKELRRHAYEEFEKKQKRIEESEKRFAQWLIAKKKEARRAWREKRARKRVDTVENEDTIRKDNDPPPNYTVVPTFKGAQAWTGGEDVSHNNGKTCKTLHAHLKTINPEQSPNDNVAESNPSDQASLDKDNSENYNKTPTTAYSRNIKLSKRNTQEKWPKQERNCSKRPSTSDGRLTGTKDCMVQKEIKGKTHEAWMLHKRKEEKSRRPTTAHASQLKFEDGQKPTKKSITFEAWKAQKRQESKEKAKLKRREIVDDTLTEAIINMARKRVENSYKEKRQLDTGMPKWQARNRIRATGGAEKNASISNTSHSKYAVIQLLGDEQDNLKAQEADTQTKKVAAVRKSCENLKSH